LNYFGNFGIRRIIANCNGIKSSFREKKLSSWVQWKNGEVCLRVVKLEPGNISEVRYGKTL